MEEVFDIEIIMSVTNFELMFIGLEKRAKED